jgi:hypothetical protein
MYRQFMRGLSSGIFVLAILGALCLFFATWCALCVRSGKNPLADAGDIDFPLVWLLLNLAVAAALAYGGARVRRKAAGFQWGELRSASKKHREDSSRLRTRFLWTVAAEWVVITMAVLLALRAGRPDLIWPGVALGISLHFAPLAYLFRLRPYYFTAAGGSLASIFSLAAPPALLPPAERLLLASLGLGAATWITAAYLILNAEGLARSWDDDESPRTAE